MKLSIIIVNWNAGDLLHDCIRSVVSELHKCGLLDTEIILIDNASSDKSITSLEDDFPELCYIRNSENLGFARATNQGIRHSTGQYILLLNPDTKVFPGALGQMMQFLEFHPGIGAIGPMLLNVDGSLQISAYPEPTIFREAWRLFYLDKLWPMGSYRMGVWSTDVPRQVDVLTGACILLRRNVLNQCGLLDERYFIYSEDQDLCRRLRSHGWKIFWMPQAKVMHYGAQSTRQVKADMFIRLYREKIAYFRRHHGGFSASMYKLVLYGASAVRQILSPLALLTNKEQRWQLFELARFYRMLIRELPGL